MSGDRLVSRSVGEFVAGVASVDEPVPAGGSVAALTAAASAALLALACGVQLRKASGSAERTQELEQAQRLQERLLTLVDEDAAAFQAFLHARRAAHGAAAADATAPASDRAAAARRAGQVPLDIAAACAEVVGLSERVEAWSGGPVRADVRSARVLAGAALAAALLLATENLALLDGDAPAQAQIREQIARLRDV